MEESEAAQIHQQTLFQLRAPDDMKEEQEAIPERTAGSLEADLGFQTEDQDVETEEEESEVPWKPRSLRGQLFAGHNLRLEILEVDSNSQGKCLGGAITRRETNENTHKLWNLSYGMKKIYDIMHKSLTELWILLMTDLLQQRKALRSFGYNDAINNSSKAYPFIKRVPVPELEKINPPLSLQRKFVDFNKFGNSS
ncbi:hypothetical protein MJO29_005564 [Puccinia striiformis f. sp. tritici]|nr:hypothetical protein MJO29_005564 [Puccinia striiformis f. sp. tritici]